MLWWPQDKCIRTIVKISTLYMLTYQYGKIAVWGLEYLIKVCVLLNAAHPEFTKISL